MSNKNRDNIIRDIAGRAIDRSTSVKEVTDVFDYLDRLRDLGVTNMFHAVPYIMAYNDKLSRKQAMTILWGWMESYGK